MAALVQDADAFDVIELMRLRELGVATQAAPGGSALAIEIVAAVLLSRGSRKPSALPRDETRPHVAVNELHQRALRLMRLAQARQLAEAALNRDPLSMLAAEYQGAVMGIRNLQYSSVRDAHEARLFDNERAANLMQKHLGYTYPQVVAVREAIREVSSQRMTELRDGTAEIMLRNQGVPPGQIPAAEAEEVVSQMVALMFLPGDRATISANDVAPLAGVDDETALAVLTSFSQFFDSAVSAMDRVYDMLVGTNPFLGTPLVSDGAGNFVSTSNEVGNDSLRRIFEKALTSNGKDFTAYDQKIRVAMSEQIALDGLASILETAPSHAASTLHPKKTRKSASLGPGVRTPPRSASKSRAMASSSSMTLRSSWRRKASRWPSSRDEETSHDFRAISPQPSATLVSRLNGSNVSSKLTGASGSPTRAGWTCRKSGRFVAWRRF